MTSWFNLSVLFAIGLFALGCGNLAGQNSPETGCSSNAALIGVQDASLVRLCGCNEAAGAIVPPSTLTCTVPAGTHVHFQFLGTRQQHQIIFDAGANLPNGPMSIPDSESPIRGFAVQVTSSGTYGFSDAMLPGFLVGEIVVP